MRNALLVALGFLFIAFIWKAVDEAQRPRARGHAWTRADDPFEPDSLRARMERIAPLVARAVGDPIDVAQVRIHAVDDRFAAERELAARSPELLDTTRDSFRQESVASAFAPHTRRSDILGAYAAKSDTIDLYPYQFDSVVPDSIDAVLDIVVAHELAHAWQDQRSGLLGEFESESRDAAFARRAVIEGSAEFVGQHVARALGTASVFDRLAGEAGKAMAEARAMGHWPITRRWFYSEGLRFIEAVHEAWADEPDWDGLFRRLPRSVAAIERPQDWLESRAPRGADPDGAIKRLRLHMEGAQAGDSNDAEWQYLPIPTAAVRDRLALASIPLDHAAWRSCTGGVHLSAEPDAGALRDAGVSMRVWWFGSEGDALAARATLERSASDRGARAWVRREDVEFAGPVRVRKGRLGTMAYAQAGMDRARGEFHEEVCAVGSYGPWLFEATTDCVGGSPALLEFLDLAIRAWRGGSMPALADDGSGPWELPAGASVAARDRLIIRALAKPGGERDVVTWLRTQSAAPAAYMAALGAAAGDDERGRPERDEALVASLRSEDPDVRRFALRVLGEWDCVPRPFAAKILPLLRKGARDPDAEIRALCVDAARRLELEEPFESENLSMLLGDASAFVRAALARGSDELPDAVWKQLLGDDDAIVRAAAQSSRGGRDRIGVRVYEWIARRYGASPEKIRAHAELDSLSGVDWEEISAIDRRSKLVRLRRLLASSDDTVRLLAIFVASSVDGDRSRLVAGLLDTFATGPHRRAAVAALRAGESDLAAHRPRLVRMIENPFMRVDTLRVLVARDVTLSEATESRVRAWTQSRGSALACAAALVVDDESVIEQRWREVHRGFRCQIIDTVLRRRPDSALAARLREVALMSPYDDEREAVYDALESDQHCAAHWNALLKRIAAGGSEVSGECWTDLSDRIGALSSADAADAASIATRHLHAWCDRDRLPTLSWYENSPYSWEFKDWPSDPAFLAALDRCILRRDAASTRLFLALVRVANTGGKLPEPVAAAVSALFAASPIQAVPVASEIHEAAARCEFVSAELLCELIRRRTDATSRGRRRYSYVRDWIGEGPGRKQAARALLPELLERNSRAHVDAALEILSELDSASPAVLDRLRELRSRAMPSWRERIDRRLARLE